ncbi:unnamed protein product [Schistosoma turkestanicum]|nr:unnamed protein product [Schistosoma turkestanicum]
MKRSDSASIRSTQQKTHHDNNIDKLTDFKKTPNSPCTTTNNNNNHSNHNHNNHNSNSPTFSIHSAPFLLNPQPNDTTQLTPKSTMYDANIGSFSMTSVKEILERLKMEVEFERNKRTIIARQRNQDIHKLTTRSKAENRILLCALKHAENKARMYRDEYHKLKTKVQTKLINSEQENCKNLTTNAIIRNKEIFSNEKRTFLKNQSDWMINRNDCKLLSYSCQKDQRLKGGI